MNSQPMPRPSWPAIDISRRPVARGDEVLTPKALELLAELHRCFNPRRLQLLALRQRRQAELDRGRRPDFLAETAHVREGDWRIGELPADLIDRRVELTGPPSRKLLLDGLNAQVATFVADFEDACAPTWENLIAGQVNLADAVRRQQSSRDDRSATLIVRPRGWHLPEKHVQVDGQTVSGALFDFALYVANNHQALAHSGSAPYFCLPKLEGHLEARLWNDIFVATQQQLGLARGAIKATVLIETILAAFEMDEILFELRDHAAGLNCGRWDYIFSFIKKFRNHRDAVLPDRDTVTMDAPFLKSYADLLIKTCHRRGAYAIGGLAAQILVRGDPQANEAAMQTVRNDKLREVRAGHDGTWVADPALAPIAAEAFNSVMQGRNQLHVMRDEVRVTAADLLRVPQGAITDAGLRRNIRIGVRYLEAWLGGNGCVPLYHLMEDAATAEICRAQLWQWLVHEARSIDGAVISQARFDQTLTEEIERIHMEVGGARRLAGVFPSAARLLSAMVTSETFDEFLTLPAYELLG
jgi:malate synthase